MLCDWLPPDFGAVGQYTLMFARQRVQRGENVILGGLSSQASSVSVEQYGARTLTIIKMRRPTYDKTGLLSRAIWTGITNILLLARFLPRLARAREVIFTGSPPLMVHLLVPVAKCLGVKTCYRITDFFPECMMAGRTSISPLLALLYRITLFWRRRVDKFEALGEDQRRRLLAIGIRQERISLVRDPSPVHFSATQSPAARPDGLKNVPVILYSGNLGVAHEMETFLSGWERYHREGNKPVGLWLNATGSLLSATRERLESLPFPWKCTNPVALDALASVLLAADAHLITLRNEFVGFVLPSKVYACIESRRPIIFVGSVESDVHLLCTQRLPGDMYFRVEPGDTDSLIAALHIVARNFYGRQQQ